MLFFGFLFLWPFKNLENHLEFQEREIEREREREIIDNCYHLI